MNTLRTRHHFLLGLFFAGALLSLPALSATPTPTPSAQAAEINVKFEQDKANCLAGKPGAARDACMREATKARTSARNAPIHDDATYRDNKFDRCRVLAGDEAQACFARMKGEGSTSGSVAGGGVLREKVTIEVGPVPTAASAPAASAASAP
ncbi:MAG: hypothetical protein ABL916_07815 [Burkholderiaceae bacterium]